MPSRRQFIVQGSVAGSVLLYPLRVAAGRSRPAGPRQESAQEPSPAPPQAERPPRLDLDMVREMVGKSHSDLDRVRQLVADEPRLVNACHDWTAGDFETALGAASHTGQREIALFLLEHGARMDIFAATMLGETEIVRAALTACPGLIDAPGPHGIPLIKHAEKGGPEAAEVFEYLQSLKP